VLFCLRVSFKSHSSSINENVANALDALDYDSCNYIRVAAGASSQTMTCRRSQTLLHTQQ